MSKCSQSVTSVLLSTKLNRFSELSLCVNGGSSNVGIGKYKNVEGGFDILNDIGEFVENVSSFDEMLNFLGVSDYVIFDHNYNDLISWHRNNNKDYYIDKKMNDIIQAFNIISQAA
jgi:hypothetical protein